MPQLSSETIDRGREGTLESACWLLVNPQTEPQQEFLGAALRYRLTSGSTSARHTWGVCTVSKKLYASAIFQAVTIGRKDSQQASLGPWGCVPGHWLT